MIFSVALFCILIKRPENVEKNEKDVAEQQEENGAEPGAEVHLRS